MKRFAVVLLLAIAAPGGLRAQDAVLARADSLFARGEGAAARAAVDAWWRNAERRSVTGAARAHALFLRAELSTDATAAEDDYLAIALDYPLAAQAPEALLRAGQSLLARGETERALVYLQRLERDHPRADNRVTGLVWLARARRAAGFADAACDAATLAAAASHDEPAIRALAQQERRTACSPAVAAAPQPAAPAQQTAPPPAAAGTPAAASREAPAALRYAVQVGAFRARTGAETVATRVRRAGAEPRIVRVQGGTLLRVRAGRFATSGEAEALRRRLVDAGLEAAVVADVQREESADADG